MIKFNSYKKPRYYQIALGESLYFCTTAKGRWYISEAFGGEHKEEFDWHSHLDCNNKRSLKRRLKMIGEGVRFYINIGYDPSKDSIYSDLETKFFIKTKNKYKEITEDAYYAEEYIEDVD